MIFRSVFISDLHLGSKGCQADLLLSFLRKVECENLYLVGDVIDLIALKRTFYWPESHTLILKEIVKKSKNGTNVHYIIGNHDRGMSILPSFGKIDISRSTVHTSADGKKYLVVHGDQFDKIISHKTGMFWMRLGSFAYDKLLVLNTLVNKIGRFFGIRYWSIADVLKRSLKISLNFINNFEKQAMKMARDGDYDGIICGHIHSAKIDGGYMNDGDWVDCCTSIVEDYDGVFKIRKDRDH